MGYIALYRKYRPITFDNIIGQENVTKILKNQIKTGKISHAYIFSGTRGTGKTSAAKVFSRAINCLNPKDGEPCNECEVCKNILEGNTTDVIEMDAASNNSVENIRQIRQEVVYATIDVKYRVYIIDEAHMLTTSAFNALLKTLEEPPANVVFILATTEQHKIPVTILSRCLRFDFNRLSEDNIIERLKVVLEEEKIKYEDEAVNYIAKLAEGGMRDALSILERCVSESQDILKYEDVLRIVGAIDSQIINKIADCILNKESVPAIECIDDIVKKGKDLRQVNYQLTEEFLNRLIKENDGNSYIVKIIDRLSKLDNDLRLTSKPVIVFKSAVIELCSGINSSSNETNSSNVLSIDSNMNKKIVLLENEISDLKNKINKLESEGIKVSKGVPNTNKVNNIGIKKEPIPINKENLKLFPDTDNFKKNIVESGHIKLYSAIAGTKIYTDDNNLIIVTNNSFAYSILSNDQSIDILKDEYLKMYGNEITVYIRLKETQNESVNKMEDTLKKNNIDYTNID